MSSIGELSHVLYRAACFSSEWHVLFMASQALSRAERASKRTDRIECLRRAERGLQLAINRGRPGQEIILPPAPRSRQIADRIRDYERDCRRLQDALVGRRDEEAGEP